MLGDVGPIEEGQTVKATGDILSVLVGDDMLGRVVNALGSPSTARPPGQPTTRRMEIQAPGITGRKPVHEPLQTGIKAIDSMTPIGRGRRELIIGDRKTGKTTVAMDTVLNQQGLGVKCIYVAVGQKGSTVAQTVATLESHGALEYTVVVSVPGVGRRSVQVPRSIRRLRHGPASTCTAACSSAPPSFSKAQRRRLAHRAADHRDEGRRHLRLHPHQRDLDHRRPGLPAGRPVQVRCASRLRHRPIGVPGGWRRPDQGHEDGGGHAEGRPVPVPAARGVRRLRIRARQGEPGSPRPWVPARRAAQAAAATARCRCEEQVVSIYSGTGGFLDRHAGGRRAPLRQELLEWCGPATPPCSTPSARPATSPEAEAASRTSSTPSRRAVQATEQPEEEKDRRVQATRTRGLSPWRVVRSASCVNASSRCSRRRRSRKAMELIAASRILQGPAAGERRSSLQRADHRGDPQPGRRRGKAARRSSSSGGRSARSAFVVVAADRGLCGGYNTNVIRAAERGWRRLRDEGKQTRSSPSARRPPATSASAATSSTTATSASPTSPPTRTPAASPSPSSQRFEEGEYDTVELVYTQFISAGVQRVQLKRFVPLETDVLDAAEKSDGPAADYEFEPGPGEILDRLLPSLRRGPPLRRPARRARPRSSPPSSAP